MLTFSSEIIKKNLLLKKIYWLSLSFFFSLLFLGSVGSFAPDNFQFKPMHIPNISTPLGENNYQIKIFHDKKPSIRELFNWT